MSDAHESATSTIPPAPDIHLLHRGRLIRRAFLLLVFLALILALTTRLGVHSSTVAASGRGYSMRVTYAAVTRPGLDTPLVIELTHPGGFTGPVTFAVSAQYLDLFDKNGGLDPDPSQSSSDEAFVYWTFDPPSGNTLRVSLDAILAPSQEWGKRGIVRLVNGDTPVVGVTFRTWVMP
jgi:hypothetical protein